MEQMCAKKSRSNEQSLKTRRQTQHIKLAAFVTFSVNIILTMLYPDFYSKQRTT